MSAGKYVAIARVCFCQVAVFGKPLSFQNSEGGRHKVSRHFGLQMLISDERDSFDLRAGRLIKPSFWLLEMV
jgi:hypothetical protein